MGFLRPFRQRPLRSSLLLLQVFLGSLIVTLALSAAFGSRTPDTPPERFNLIAGYETENESGSYSVFYSKDLPDLLELAPDVEQVAIVGDLYDPTVIVGDTRYMLRSGARVSAGYFGLEPPEMVRGTVFTAAEVEGGENVALLSESAAGVMFGDADPVGKTLNLEPEFVDPEGPPIPPTAYRVVGTFNAPTALYNESPALYLPYANSPDVPPASSLSVRAKPGRGEAARAQLLSAARQVYADAAAEQGAEEGKDFFIRVPGETSFGPEGIDQDVLVFGLFGVVAFIVSVIGIFAATLIETEERSHEIGVRRALGASAARIGWGLVGRALGVAVLGSLAGIAGAALLIPLFQGPAQSVAMFSGTPLTFEPLAAAVVLGTVTLVSGVLGLVPAFRAGRLKPVQALRESI